MNYEKSHPKPPRRTSGFRKTLRWTARLIGIFILLMAIAFLVLFRTALYHRFVVFPAESAAWDEIRAQRREVLLDDGWPQSRGACHNHSELSHDSEVSFPEILHAAKQADLDFILMADHCVDGKADYSLGWRGMHDGVVFIRGFEMAHGFMPWGLPDDTVLNRDTEPRTLAREIHEKGGLLFFAHPEEDRLWDLPELTGMEIYNLHADFKDEDLRALLPDLILNLRAYPDQTLRLIFDPQTAILARWDELNQTRRIVGIGANDAHQNTGLRGYYTERDTFLLRERGPSDIKEWNLNAFTRFLLRLLFGPLEPGKELFCITLDPYVQSLRYVNTHLLAREKSETALLEALGARRAFVAFDMIVDARGFTYLADDGRRKAVIGETVFLTPELVLLAESPIPCHFVLVRNGERETEQTGRTFTHPVSTPGVYRLEAELKIRDAWIPWVYTNPIFVRDEGDAPGLEAPPG